MRVIKTKKEKCTTCKFVDVCARTIGHMNSLGEYFFKELSSCSAYCAKDTYLNYFVMYNELSKISTVLAIARVEQEGKERLCVLTNGDNDRNNIIDKTIRDFEKKVFNNSIIAYDILPFADFNKEEIDSNMIVELIEKE